MTKEQIQTGIHEARRIIKDAAGFYFGGELIPFAPEFKALAFAAIEELEKNQAIPDRQK
jgi:hypothetical protein